MVSPGSWLADTGFGHPRGLLGRLGGRIMARGNTAAERHLIDLAELDSTDVVLVVGPGPGVGLQQAAERAGEVIGIDPSEVMLDACRRRCASFIEQGRVRLISATAQQTEQADDSVDAVLSVNNVSIWSDRLAGCAELARVLRPGGRMLLSTHQKWLPGGLTGLTQDVAAAGFTGVDTRIWNPPGRFATPAAQLTARRAKRPDT